ncbi:Kievitone hydratase [Pseudocercospora fuligena]|uniref:Kievitone hydratase n=1 Tax=Pseudocercospora fuligena TaxID=685502 RepID=A0A8H6RBP1_9PEZI|nr:Kievitone hydratase [Pseudocercospora fuligena]
MQQRKFTHLANAPQGGGISLIVGTPTAPFTFRPDAAGNGILANYPLINYNVTALQTDYTVWPATSWWTNAFVTTTCGNQFLILCQIFYSTNTSGVATSSVLSLDKNGTTAHYSRGVVVDRPETVLSPDGRLSINYPNVPVTFEGLSSDSLEIMRNAAKALEYDFDFTWQTTSPIILNWGGTEFYFGDPDMRTVEWSFPSNKILNGTISFLGSDTMQIDPSNSLVWYDRQVNNGFPQYGWTWFALQFPGSDIKVTIWEIHASQDEKSYRRFATARTRNGTILMPVEDIIIRETWKSEKSGFVYGTAFTIKFGNGDVLEVKSIRDDQEIGPGKGNSIYEGFAHGEGEFLGQKELFGLVEQLILGSQPVEQS